VKKTTTQSLEPVNEKTLIVAIDIGKSVHYAYFRAPQGQEIKPFSVRNRKRDFEALWNKIVHYKEEQKLETIFIGFESTGSYAEPIKIVSSFCSSL